MQILYLTMKCNKELEMRECINFQFTSITFDRAKNRPKSSIIEINVGSMMRRVILKGYGDWTVFWYVAVAAGLSLKWRLVVQRR